MCSVFNKEVAFLLGTNRAPVLTDCSMQISCWSFSRKTKGNWHTLNFNLTFRYMDDIIFRNSPLLRFWLTTYFLWLAGVFFSTDSWHSYGYQPCSCSYRPFHAYFMHSSLLACHIFDEYFTIDAHPTESAV